MGENEGEVRRLFPHISTDFPLLISLYSQIPNVYFQFPHCIPLSWNNSLSLENDPPQICDEHLMALGPPDLHGHEQHPPVLIVGKGRRVRKTREYRIQMKMQENKTISANLRPLLLYTVIQESFMLGNGRTGKNSLTVVVQGV